MWTAETTSSTGSSATGASACDQRFRAAGPVQAPLQIDFLQVVLDELADARRAVDMRDDFEEEVRFGERGLHAREVGGSMLVAHCAGRDADRAVVERAHQGVRLRSERWTCELLGKAPQARVRRQSAGGR